MQIGVNLSSMDLPLRQALTAASRLGIRGVSFDVGGDLSPERLTDTGRRELRNLLKTHALELTALNCALRHGLDVFENQNTRIDYVRRVMDLAFELGPRCVIVPCPQLANDAESPQGKCLRDAFLDLGLYGDRIGTTVALEIGFDPTDKFREYLNTFDVGSLGVNYDPANLLLHGYDPVKSLLPLEGKILQVTARDARRATVNLTGAETPLGAGDIEWLGFVGTLTAIEYRGWMTVKRDAGSNRLNDLAAGVSFLRRVIL